MGTTSPSKVCPEIDYCPHPGSPDLPVEPLPVQIRDGLWQEASPHESGRNLGTCRVHEWQVDDHDAQRSCCVVQASAESD